MTMIRGNGIESGSIEHALNSQRGASEIISLNEINSVPDHILARIHTHSIQGFSSCLETYKLNQYEVECNRANCYVCQQHLQNNVCPCQYFSYIYVLFHCFFSLFFILLVFFLYFFLCLVHMFLFIYNLDFFVLFVCLKLTFQFCRIRW